MDIHVAYVCAWMLTAVAGLANAVVAIRLLGAFRERREWPTRWDATIALIIVPIGSVWASVRAVATPQAGLLEDLLFPALWIAVNVALGVAGWRYIVDGRQQG